MEFDQICVCIDTDKIGIVTHHFPQINYRIMPFFDISISFLLNIIFL